MKSKKSQIGIYKLFMWILYIIFSIVYFKFCRIKFCKFFVPEIAFFSKIEQGSFHSPDIIFFKSKFLEIWLWDIYYYFLWYIIHFEFFGYKLINFIWSKCKN